MTCPSVNVEYAHNTHYAQCRSGQGDRNAPNQSFLRQNQGWLIPAHEMTDAITNESAYFLTGCKSSDIDDRLTRTSNNDVVGNPER